MNVEVARRSPKPAPEEIMKVWVRKWSERGARRTMRGCGYAEAFIYAALARLVMRRLARA